MTAEKTRTLQTKKLWEAGWGEALGIPSFKQYLAGIPSLPKWTPENTQRFPCPILVDRRIDFLEACKRLNISCTHRLSHFINDEDQLSDLFTPPVYWMLCQEGTINLGKNTYECRMNFPVDECGLDILEGLCFIAQHRSLLVDQCLVLSRSLPARHLRLQEAETMGRNPEDRGKKPGQGELKPAEIGAACLKVWNGDPTLEWVWGMGASSRFGIASRLKENTLSPGEVLEKVTTVVALYKLQAEFLPKVLSVGVGGDYRTYTPVICLKGPYPGNEVLAQLSTLISNTTGINRVTYQVEPDKVPEEPSQPAVD